MPMPASAGTGSHATLQPQPSQIHTRANQVPDHMLTHEELLKMYKDSLTTVDNEMRIKVNIQT